MKILNKDFDFKTFSFTTKQDKEQEKPKTGSSYTRNVDNRGELSYDESLTPTSLKAAIGAANDGDVTQLIAIYTKMEEADTRVKTTLQTRRNAVAGRPWNIIAASDDPKDKEIAEFVKGYIENIRGFKDSTKHLLNAVGSGYSVCEINWQTSLDEGYKYTIPTLTDIPAGRFSFEESYAPQLLNENFAEPKPLEPNKFIVFTYDAKAGLINRAGVMRSIAVLYMLKSFSTNDWARYSEIAGVPYRMGFYPQGANEDDIEIVRAALEDLGSDLSIMAPKGFDIEIDTVSGGSSTTFKSPQQGLIEWIDKSISQVVLGQTLTTDGSDGGSGSFALGKIHSDVKDDLLTDDADSLSTALTEQLITPIVNFHFGYDINIPKFQYDLTITPNLTEEIKIDKDLFKELGLPVDKNYMYKKYNVPAPEEDAELLEVPNISPAEPEDEEESEDDVSANSISLSDIATIKLFADNGESHITVEEANARIDANVITRVAATTEIMSSFLLKLNGVMSASNSFDEAIKGVENYTLSKLEVNEFASEFKKSQVEMYNFGKFSINPDTIPKAFANGFGFPDIVDENVLDYIRVQSMSVAHVTHKGVLESIKKSLISGKQTGMLYSEFARDLSGVFAKTGVTPLNPFHLETVYIQNSVNAYQNGKFTEMTTPDMLETFPYWQYLTIGDDHVRPAHQAMDGHIAKNTDSVWATWYPPNGFRCRCDIEVMTQSEVEALGITDSAKVPELNGNPVKPDKRFNSNPSKTAKEFQKWVDTKVVWGDVPAMYFNAPIPPINTLDLWSASLAQQMTLSNPDEAWGIMKSNAPEITYFKSFNDSGVIKTVKVVVISKSSGDVVSMSDVSNINEERSGVPILEII